MKIKGSWELTEPESDPAEWKAGGEKLEREKIKILKMTASFFVFRSYIPHEDTHQKLSGRGDLGSARHFVIQP